MDGNDGKEWKIERKLTFFLLKNDIWNIDLSNNKIKNDVIVWRPHSRIHVHTRAGVHAHTRANAHPYTRAPSNSDVVFLLSQVSHQSIFSSIFHPFSLPLLPIYPSLSFHRNHSPKTTFWTILPFRVLKKCTRIANTLIHSVISKFCDTCDSKKCKTPVYVRAWASKKSILAFITITLSVKMMNPQNYHFYSPHQRNHFSKTTSPKSSSLKSSSPKFSSPRSTSTDGSLFQNDGSFSLNRQVVFHLVWYTIKSPSVISCSEIQKGII